MIAIAPPPTDQRAGVRPIAFALDVNGDLGAPVQLSIRPEDLTRNEPVRATVHQTLGRGISGWADNFGRGLPSVTISGHTGWRFSHGSNMDGAEAFEALNQLVVHDFSAAKQAAIDSGSNPASVQLLFIDTLDNFAWSVLPMQFILRRSKSRPLLFQYNITLQAVNTEIEVGEILVPNLGNPSNGLFALRHVIDDLTKVEHEIGGWVAAALHTNTGGIDGIASRVSAFTSFATGIFSAANVALTANGSFTHDVPNYLIALGARVARVGANLFKTINSQQNIPNLLMSNLIAVATSFNDVLCIFSNSLRQREVYEQYTGLNGASSCSSTTGGSPINQLLGINVFQEMLPEKEVITMSTAAISSIAVLMNMDPVLSPLPMSEISRHVGNIAGGTTT
jgi:hypothetical protein